MRLAPPTENAGSTTDYNMKLELLVVHHGGLSLCTIVCDGLERSELKVV